MTVLMLLAACAGPDGNRLGATREAPFTFSGTFSAGWIVLAQGDELGDARLWMTSGGVDCERLETGELADLSAEGDGLVAFFTWDWTSYDGVGEAPESTFVGSYAQALDAAESAGGGYVRRRFEATPYVGGVRYEAGAGNPGLAEILEDAEGRVVGTISTPWFEAEYDAEACAPAEVP